MGNAGEGKAYDGDANSGECRTPRRVWRKPCAHFRGSLVLGDGLSGQRARRNAHPLPYKIHTKESLTVTFKRDGKYDQEALKKLNHFMRDWRADAETKMDPALIDLIWTLHKQLGSNEPVHLISGYRSAATNASLRKKGGGQAKKSQHIQGRAADIHFPDVAVKTLRNSALVHEVGGVGYYPTSGVPFVHVDTGHVRMWPRIPRLELAALFPDGKTGYLPNDNKPITRQDYKLALAKGLVNNTMIASAAPAAKIKPAEVVAQAEFDAENEVDTPQPVLASYTPDVPAIADDPHQPGSPPPPGAAVHLCQRRRHVAAGAEPVPPVGAQGAGSPAGLSGRRSGRRTRGRRRPSRRVELRAVRDRRADDRCVGHL